MRVCRTFFDPGAISPSLVPSSISTISVSASRIRSISDCFESEIFSSVHDASSIPVQQTMPASMLMIVFMDPGF